MMIKKITMGRYIKIMFSIVIAILLMGCGDHHAQDEPIILNGTYLCPERSFDSLVFTENEQVYYYYMDPDGEQQVLQGELKQLAADEYLLNYAENPDKKMKYDRAKHSVSLVLDGERYSFQYSGLPIYMKELLDK